ncbi:hypothetical protein [Serratia marcescens]|uniref:hypothetical protein n=1 Tax=Serratia TaxID=613 RepID=UPI000D72758F|nr:hypothetical protein [Serratia marcescens]AWQ48254.1 hypothetical protein B1A42_13285 [Serratia marcescens]
MKDYKSNLGTKFLLLLSLALYMLLPPLLTAGVFSRFNLNPFAIVKFLHFNPFMADRGIPGYQTFLYLLMLWAGLNIFLWLVVCGTGRLYQRWRTVRG